MARTITAGLCMHGCGLMLLWPLGGLGVCARVLGGGFGTRPWWLALLACGGAHWPLAFKPSAMTSRHPHYCGHPHCRTSWVGVRECWEGGGVPY